MKQTCVSTWNSDHRWTWQQQLKLLLQETTAPVRAERAEEKVQRLEGDTQAVRLEGGCYSLHGS